MESKADKLRDDLVKKISAMPDTCLCVGSCGCVSYKYVCDLMDDVCELSNYAKSLERSRKP